MIEFTKVELKNLLIAFIVLTICFSIATAGLNVNRILSVLPIVIVGVVIGSLLHELGHKYVAMKYGCDAEFKLWPLGLVIAFVTSFFGFVFASPGSIQIHPDNRSDEINGRILIAGPKLHSVTFNLIYLICTVGFSVNSFLATFNLFPIYSLDGTKVLKWNAKIWFIAIAIAGVMMLGSIFIGAENMVQILMGL